MEAAERNSGRGGEVPALPNLILKPGREERVAAGHPWVYAGEIGKIAGAPRDGDPVVVRDAKRRFLGVGFYNSRSRIRVRILARERVLFDKAFFRRRIEAAWALRRRRLPRAECARAVNSEGDFLSGLVADKYGEALVIQTLSLGMDRRKKMLVEVLRELFSPRVVVERNDAAAREFEGLERRKGVLEGETPGKVWVRMGDLEFAADLLEGHKTGLYLDQQVNYQLAAELIAERPGAIVLDAFCFTGGFGLHAAKAGAAKVHFVDQSEEAIRQARAHAERNGLIDRCSFEAANVFDWLRARSAWKGAGERSQPLFDVVILDPPSFTRSREAIPEALRGYKEIHIRALKLLRPGGLLLTFCCSHHVDALTFRDAVAAAAADTRACLRHVASFTQAPDHPFLLAVPETEYLKGYAFELAA
ncbi:MAG: class I SAM-dependent rRNA methyltransferase [Verrucomicrobia bacterium]|nr:class I SAM-dependent rRNA methyltransferase [Verrucomicrobiota bacterium]